MGVNHFVLHSWTWRVFVPTGQSGSWASPSDRGGGGEKSSRGRTQRARAIRETQVWRFSFEAHFLWRIYRRSSWVLLDPEHFLSFFTSVSSPPSPAVQTWHCSGFSSLSKQQSTWCATSTGGWPSKLWRLSWCSPSWVSSSTTCRATWWRRCWGLEDEAGTECYFLGGCRLLLFQVLPCGSEIWEILIHKKTHKNWRSIIVK